jgi:hypothetical protein
MRFGLVSIKLLRFDVFGRRTSESLDDVSSLVASRRTCERSSRLYSYRTGDR